MTSPAPARATQVREVLRPVLGPLAERFAAEGFQLALVGGPVRDALRGSLDLARNLDLDLTTPARPDDVLRLIEGYADAVWTTGIEFGTVALMHDGFQIEITTYRADRYDRVSRKPGVVYGDSLTEDLSRRDFTVNAMAVSVIDGTFTDPYGGLADLAAGVLRTPAAPEESFADDPLRIFRAVRFVGQLGFTIDPATADSAARMSGELARVSAERQRDELTKLLLSEHPRAGLEMMVDLGIADVVLPELSALRMEIDEHHQHKDVYTHSLTVLEQAMALEHRLGEAPDLVIRLAALLHDIGKPATRRHEAGGGVSFHHHEVVGAKLVRKRLRALRYPKVVVDDVAALTFLHLRFHGFSGGQWTDSAVRRYVADAGALLPRLHVLTRSDCTTRNRRRADALSRSYDELEARIVEIEEAENLRAVRPDLDGNAIMQILGLEPGPTVGRAWSYLKELRLDRGPLEYDDAVAELKAWATREGITPAG